MTKPSSACSKAKHEHGRAKVALDTNFLLAALIKPEVLPTDTQTLLQNPASTVYFSAASL